MKKLLFGIFFLSGLAYADPVSYIQLRKTLQPASPTGVSSTLFVSSGTINTFAASTMAITNTTTVSTVSVSGRIQLPDTLAASPSLTGRSQTNKGIFFQSNSLGFAISGSTVAVADTTGFRVYQNFLGVDGVFGGTGATGTHTQGSMRLFPLTASKGSVLFTAADSAGSTTTTEQWASQGGARTYTHVDFGQSGNYAVSTSTGPKYILQTPVQCSVTASSSTSATTYVNSNLTCSITPTQATSLIRISVSGELASNAGTAATTTAATLARNGSNLFGTSGFAIAESQTAGLTVGMVPTSLSGYYDSPATTSAVTYAIQIKALSGTTTAVWCQNNMTCRITLEEIGQ